MKGFSKKFMAVALAGCMAFPLAACGGGDDEGPDRYYDNESDPLRIATLSVDEVFNPFFSSSGTDANVVGYTQLGMIANDAAGNPVYGENEPVLALDYEMRGNGKPEPEPGEEDERETTYYFVLKNNVRFSDGSYVTIKDVLFNLYVYLDMAYTGSSTIYSTDIVGLEKYRTQEADKNEQDAFMDTYEELANTRISDLLEASQEILDGHKGEQFTVDQFAGWLDDYTEANGSDTNYKHLSEDYRTALKRFKEELDMDFSNSMDSYQDQKFSDENGKVYENLFTTDVEMFLYNENYITWSKKDGELTYPVTDPAIVRNWTREYAIDYVARAKIPQSFTEIIEYWNTGITLKTDITNQELEAASATMKKDFPSIEGIKFANGGEFGGGADSVTVNGKTYPTPTYADDSHNQVVSGNEVLSITINGVDPKAIWNFAFAVAPMYYYSDAEHIAAFDYKTNFGVAWNSKTFMEKTVNSPSKIGLPVGAGPYMASKASGGTDNVTASDFYDKTVIYYERNPYYIGGPAKVKKLRLVVVSSTQMLNNLYTGQLDYADPNAKPETEQEINGKKNLGSKQVTTLGYGYIGINAGKIPQLEVRQAIMYCINTSLAVDYYQTQAKAIYRPMSTESWAYPEGCIAYYPYIGGPIPAGWDTQVIDPRYKQFVQRKNKSAGQTFTPEEQREFIEGLMTDAGLEKNADGKYPGCKHIFTIAGEGTDHPAWQALFNASNTLNSYGFDITVKNDSQALSKLTNGSLTVWAAAWGSTIDPDMYQVYHKDSTATSVKNWGYPQILRNAGNKYDRENTYLTALTNYIDDARNTTDQDRRKDIYKAALDEVMKLAVELPTYQRKDLFAYDKYRIDETSLFGNPTSFKGLLSDVHKVSLRVLTEEQ